MPRSPSEPASMPMMRKTSTTGTLTRSVARLKITLMASSAPKARRRMAVAAGSAAGMREYGWGPGQVERRDWRDRRGRGLLGNARRPRVPAEPRHGARHRGDHDAALPAPPPAGGLRLPARRHADRAARARAAGGRRGDRPDAVGSRRHPPDVRARPRVQLPQAVDRKSTRL